MQEKWESGSSTNLAIKPVSTIIFEDLRAGRMTIAEAKQRLTNTDRSFVEVSRDGTAPLSSVIREPQSDVSQEKEITSNRNHELWPCNHPWTLVWSA